jgi:hypothetical protein
MARKVTPEVVARMIVLRERDKLTKIIIAQRLGLSLRTVNLYLNARIATAPCTTPA